MISLNASFLDALENGSGLPIFYITLQELGVGTVTSHGTYNVTKAWLTRTRIELSVQENLLAAGLVDIITGSKWSIQVTRGLTIAGTAYTVTDNPFYISYIRYSEKEGTRITADLLPASDVSGINANQAASTVIAAAFTQFKHPSTITFDATRDIWYSWKWSDAGGTLDLVDGRLLEGMIQSKYFAYLFPRDTNKIYVYSVASNFSNNEDGTYTPFAHAQVEYFLSIDKPINLTKTDGTTITIYNHSDPNVQAFANLGYIDADPTAEAEFEDWLEIYSGNLLQFIQRPDLRLEQGDLLKVSTDGFVSTRCFEQMEYYKTGKNPAWYQIVRQLPNHPYALEKYSNPHDVPKEKEMPVSMQGVAFQGILAMNNQDLQQSLVALDAHVHSHAQLTNLGADDHTQYTRHSLATAANDFLVASGAGAFVKKTLAQVKTILGLGSAAYTASTDYAVAAKGVTNGDSHDHNGGDGAQIAYGNLSGTPSNLRLAGFYLRATANSTTILESHNITSVVDTNTGRMQVLVNTNFAAATWAPILTLIVLNTTSSLLVPAIHTTIGAGTCYMDAWDAGTYPFAKGDPTEWSLTGFGA